MCVCFMFKKFFLGVMYVLAEYHPLITCSISFVLCFCVYVICALLYATKCLNKKYQAETGARTRQCEMYFIILHSCNNTATTYKYKFAYHCVISICLIYKNTVL